MTSYKIIGLMSGTSLDGLDICLATFSKIGTQWDFQILKTDFKPYSKELKTEIKQATNSSALNLMLFDQTLGVFYAHAVLAFLDEHQINKDSIHAIASHGQTIFHQPENQFTCQIGCGESIAAITEIPVINDFRKRDVLFGGQGAPLVPIGDFKLFSNQADTFLNIGGFANYSIVKQQTIQAADICPVNIVINQLAQELNMEFDKDGLIALKYPVDEKLLQTLNSILVYQNEKPHSLGWEWFEANFLPILDNCKANVEVKLATVTEHAAYQIARRLNETKAKTVFVTGGGAKNTYLMKRIEHYFNENLLIPSTELIDFKEALIFGFLGALYLEGEANCLAQVTGASKDVVGGVYHQVAIKKGN